MKPEIQLNYKWATKGEFHVVFSLCFFREVQTIREVKS